MKRPFYLLFLCALFMLSSCGSSKNAEQKAADSLALVISHYPTFCHTLYLNILDAPATSGKTLVTLHFGDFVTLLGDSSFVQNGSKITRYRKVMLADKTEGWAVDDSLAIHALPATPRIFFLDIYERPDTTAKSTLRFDRQDFLASRPAGGGWMWVTGYNESAKKRLSGFVKEADITTDSLEARFSGLYCTLLYSAITPEPQLSPETIKLRDEIHSLLVDSGIFNNTLIYQDTYTGEEEGDPAGEVELVSGEGDEAGDEGGEPDNPGYGHAPVVVSYRSVNYPSRLITVVNGNGELAENAVPKAYPPAALFYVRYGINGKCSDCIVLESYTQSGSYLCATQAGNDVRITVVDLSKVAAEQQQAYRDAMSFRVVEGLGGNETISFSSFMDPTLFIRHRDFHLWLHRNDNSDTFAKDASFSEEEVE